MVKILHFIFRFVIISRNLKISVKKNLDNRSKVSLRIFIDCVNVHISSFLPFFSFKVREC
uniref:Uncharacterized protein n=1 Tax=Rhizophora mucronata TaxID=61149 RepID=A0A2P2N9Q1_RHIMU